MIELAYENKARQNIGQHLSFICSDYEGMNIVDQFDCVVFFDCLHHAEDERAAIATAYHALKPGGILITHEPGEGHAVALGSIEAMQTYGVNERDMPPHVIIAHGFDIGFTAHRVFPMQHEIIEIFYGPKPPPLLIKAAWLLAKRVLRAAFRPSYRASSVVVLTK